MRSDNHFSDFEGVADLLQKQKRFGISVGLYVSETSTNLADCNNYC